MSKNRRGSKYHYEGMIEMIDKKSIDSQRVVSQHKSEDHKKPETETVNKFLTLIGTKAARSPEQRGAQGGNEFRSALSEGKQKAGTCSSETNTTQKRIEEVDKHIEIIKKLKELFDDGILTREEFDAEKRYLIG